MQTLTANFYGQVEQTEVSTFLAEFHQLPLGLYLRGQLNSSPEAITKYRNDLVFHGAKGEKAVWVSAPIDYFMLTAEQVASTGLGEYGIEADKKYIVNGNNRHNVIGGMWNDPNLGEKLTFYPVPTRQILSVSHSDIMELQRTGNDTTVPHTQQNLMTAIAAYYNGLVESGKSESVASSRTCEVFHVTASYVSNAKLLSTAPEEFLGLVETGVIAQSTAITVCQSYNTIKGLLPEYTEAQFVAGLLQAYSTDLKLGTSAGKAAISANKVKQYTNQVIKLNTPSTPVETPEEPLPTGCTKQADGSVVNEAGEIVRPAPQTTPETAKPTYSEEFVTTARNNLKQFTPALGYVIDDILDDDVQPIKPEALEFLKSANKKMAQLVGEIVLTLSEPTAFTTYRELTGFLKELFERLNPSEVSDLTVLDKINAKVTSILSKDIQSIVALYTVPTVESETHVVDDIDEWDGEINEQLLADDEYDEDVDDDEEI